MFRRLRVSGLSIDWQEGLKVIEDHGAEAIALPPDQRMQLTIKSVTPFAFAKAAQLSLAAHRRRQTALEPHARLQSKRPPSVGERRGAGVKLE